AGSIDDFAEALATVLLAIVDQPEGRPTVDDAIERGKLRVIGVSEVRDIIMLRNTPVERRGHIAWTRVGVEPLSRYAEVRGGTVTSGGIRDVVFLALLVQIVQVVLFDKGKRGNNPGSPAPAPSTGREGLVGVVIVVHRQTD